MHIVVNGEGEYISEGQSLFSYLEARNFDPFVIVVERNKIIVPAESFKDTLLEQGDTLEILYFVGGG